MMEEQTRRALDAWALSINSMVDLLMKEAEQDRLKELAEREKEAEYKLQFLRKLEAHLGIDKKSNWSWVFARGNQDTPPTPFRDREITDDLMKELLGYWAQTLTDRERENEAVNEMSSYVLLQDAQRENSSLKEKIETLTKTNERYIDKNDVQSAELKALKKILKKQEIG